MDPDKIASYSAQIQTILLPLAQKLGQTGEYVFGLFVRQVYVNALINMLWTVPGIIMLVFAHKSWNKSQSAKTEDDQYGYFVIFILCLGGGLLAVLLPVAGLIQAVINPQYQAILLIIKVIQGGR